MIGTEEITDLTTCAPVPLFSQGSHIAGWWWVKVLIEHIKEGICFMKWLLSDLVFGILWVRSMEDYEIV